MEVQNHLFEGSVKVLYNEDKDGFWTRTEFNENNQMLRYEDSTGYWWLRKYDENGNQTYYENSDGYWENLYND